MVTAHDLHLAELRGASGASAGHELLQREVSKVNRLRRQSKLRLDAQPSQLDYLPERGLNRQLLVQLLTGAYVHRHENVLITGQTGCGKMYIACTPGKKA